MMDTGKIAILNRFIKERWGQFSFENYRYIASHYLDDHPIDGKKLLDLGCGNGLLLSATCLIANPALAVGMDNYQGEGSPTTDYHFVRRMHSELLLPNLRLVRGDALKLPFKDRAFDMVYISHCLHHIYESRINLKDAADSETEHLYGLLEDIQRILADDGVLVVAEAPRYNALRLMKPFGICTETDFPTKQEPDQWLYALEKSGYRNLRLKFHTPYPVRYFRRLLSTRLGRYLLSGQYYIFGYKT